MRTSPEVRHYWPECPPHTAHLVIEDDDAIRTLVVAALRLWTTTPFACWLSARRTTSRVLTRSVQRADEHLDVAERVRTVMTETHCRPFVAREAASHETRARM